MISEALINILKALGLLVGLLLIVAFQLYVFDIYLKYEKKCYYILSVLKRKLHFRKKR